MFTESNPRYSDMSSKNSHEGIIWANPDPKFRANFEGSYLNEFGSVDPLRWRVVQSPEKNTRVVLVESLYSFEEVDLL